MRTLFYPVIYVILTLFLFAAQAAQAKEEPDELLKRVTQELITALKEHDQALRQHPDEIYPIVDKILVPYVDWHAMAQWVIGRNAWMQATEKQRSQFSEEFKNLLIRTYASTLRAYNNQSIEYLPVRGGISGKSRIQISSLIKEPGKEPIRVSYRMADKGDSWKVYDITIEGVSLLKGFHSQFETDLQQEGIDGLIQRLHQHNEKKLQ